MEQQSPISIECWILMCTIYSDLDDGDCTNALNLAERLYAADRKNPHYQYLYASCLYRLLDYNASYTILKTVKTVPCLNLFAKSCFELGKLEDNKKQQRKLWEEGEQALLLALDSNELPKKMYWGDEFSSIHARHHMPSRGSLCKLLGDLYVKLDNIKAASMYYLECLHFNPFKFSAYMKLCDIAPDFPDFDEVANPQDIFSNFKISEMDLSRSPNPYNPPQASSEVSEISFSKPVPLDQVRKSNYSMPGIRDDFRDVTIQQLRSLIEYSPKILEDDDPLLENQPERSDIEMQKNEHIAYIKNDIENMRKTENYKNKYGLHKKPPAQTPQKLEVELVENENELPSTTEREAFESISENVIPRAILDDDAEMIPPTKRPKITSTKPKDIVLGAHFPKQHSHHNSREITTHIVHGMNKLMKVFNILVTGYKYQSFYQLDDASLVLQQLDDKQYSSPRVLCILGKSYYDAGDYFSARIFYKHAFVSSPWFCEGIPYYSTSLWYLERAQELNLLAYKMKHNKSHLYEAYIVAGNWAKCARGANEASEWFDKAVKLDPARSYGHALLGYEEWEKGNSLGAKEHFVHSMIANKRSYHGWYGIATSYQYMEEYAQAKKFLEEAIRLHPRHPILLSTMAELLMQLHENESALEYINKSLEIKKSKPNEIIKAKIEARLMEF